MRVPPVLALALLALAPACGVIPPYSSVRQQDVHGLHAVKVRAAFWDNFRGSTEDTTFPFDPDESFVLDRFSSYGLELERHIPGSKFTVTISVDGRRYHVEDADGVIKGNQVHLGVRRYFGDRALTGFLLAQLIYNTSLEFPGSFDMRESDDFLGWAAGGGANLALTEFLSFEVVLAYEGMPDTDTYKRLVDGPDAPADLKFSLSGPVAYAALGLHF